MKNAFFWVLALLWLAVAPASAEEELHWITPTIGSNDAVMIVNNGSDWETKLNLRSEQRKGSEVLARVYTGTRMEVYQDNGEWCTVGLRFNSGEVLTGEVMKAYLTPVGRTFSALCPLAVAKTQTPVITRIDIEIAQLKPGDKAYVLATFGDAYFLLIPGIGQGYAPASAFEALSEPQPGERIVYRTWFVPSGGVSFTDERTNDEISLVGGVQLTDCWQVEGETLWYVTYGAGIQRLVRASGAIAQDKLSSQSGIAFEGGVYDYEKSLLLRVGTVNGKPLLQRFMPNGDILWATGDVPEGAVPLDPNSRSYTQIVNSGA